MRFIIMFCLVLCAPAAFADQGQWTVMSGGDITETLTGHSIKYATATQDFRASGRTLYNAGNDSWGYWVVRDTHYCSLWPPQDLWACYGMERQGDSLRFIGAAGDITEGLLIN